MSGTCKTCGKPMTTFNTPLWGGNECGPCVNVTSPEARAKKAAEKTEADAKDRAELERNELAERERFFAENEVTAQSVTQRSWLPFLLRSAVAAAFTALAQQVGMWIVPGPAEDLADMGMKYGGFVFGLIPGALAFFVKAQPLDHDRGFVAIAPLLFGFGGGYHGWMLLVGGEQLIGMAVGSGIGITAGGVWALVRDGQAKAKLRQQFEEWSAKSTGAAHP